MTGFTTETRSNQDRVSDICNELYSQKGVKPSIRMVHAEVPDIKSTSTVHKYYAIWSREIDANEQSLYDRLGFSPEFTQGFMKEITRFSVEAEQRYKDRAIDADDQRQQAIADLERSEDKLHKQGAVLEQQTREIAELQAEIAAITNNSKAELDSEKKKSEATIGEIRQQLTQSQDENQKLSEQIDALKTDLTKADLTLEQNRALVEEIQNRNDQLVGENSGLHETTVELNVTIATQDSTLSGNNELIENLRSQHELTNKQLIKLEHNNSTLTNEISTLRTELADANKSITAGKDKLASQVKENNDAKASFADQLNRLEQTLRSHEATISGNEKLIVQLENAATKFQSDNGELTKQRDEARNQATAWKEKHDEMSAEIGRLKVST